MQNAPIFLANISEKNKDCFWRKVDRDGPIPDETKPYYSGLGPCWIFGPKCKKGKYGQIQCGGQTLQAHRLSWTLHFGEFESRLHVLHKCDNRRCVRPEHLFLGTDADNAEDKAAKGRCNPPRGMQGSVPENARIGTTNGMAIVNESLVLEIRALFESGEKISALSRRFNLSPSGTRSIITRHNWKHI